MKALLIVLLVLAAIASLPVGARVRYDADGVLLRLVAGPVRIGLLPKKKKTPKQQETEAQAYCAVWDLMTDLEKELPMAFVFYGQDTLTEHAKRYDELGIFLPNSHFLKHLEKHVQRAEEIIYAAN